MELPGSRMYTFIDEPREFALYFFEGQRLIQDLALTHPIHGRGFAYFRDVVLSVQPLVALLKVGEQFGFYIDSTEPYFRLKIETGHHGATRCTLLPEAFHEFPDAMHGLVRVLKLFPYNRPPYESVLQIEGLPLRDVVNRVLAESYQVHSAVIVGAAGDQSVMLHQLPPAPRADDFDLSMHRVRERRDGIAASIQDVFGRGLTDPDAIVAAFEGMGFRMLAWRPMELRCGCSREQMIQNLQRVQNASEDELFGPGRATLEIKCEYCKTRYTIARDELGRAPGAPH